MVPISSQTDAYGAFCETLSQSLTREDETEAYTVFQTIIQLGREVPTGDVTRLLKLLVHKKDQTKAAVVYQSVKGDLEQELYDGVIDLIMGPTAPVAAPLTTSAACSGAPAPAVSLASPRGLDLMHSMVCTMPIRYAFLKLTTLRENHQRYWEDLKTTALDCRQIFNGLNDNAVVLLVLTQVDQVAAYAIGYISERTKVQERTEIWNQPLVVGQQHFYLDYIGVAKCFRSDGMDRPPVTGLGTWTMLKLMFLVKETYKLRYVALDYNNEGDWRKIRKYFYKRFAKLDCGISVNRKEYSAYDYSGDRDIEVHKCVSIVFDVLNMRLKPDFLHRLESNYLIVTEPTASQ